MMSPTTTTIEAEARADAFARAWFERFHHSGADAPAGAWFANSPFDPACSSGLIDIALPSMIEHGGANGRLWAISLARAGHPRAQQLLGALINEASSRGVRLPPELITYSMEVQAGMIGHQKRGPKELDRLMRNHFIALCVAAIEDRFGIPPCFNSRGPTPKRRCGSMITAEAYTKLVARRGGLGAKAVEHIWRAERQRLPTLPGWSAAWDINVLKISPPNF